MSCGLNMYYSITATVYAIAIPVLGEQLSGNKEAEVHIALARNTGGKMRKEKSMWHERNGDKMIIDGVLGCWLIDFVLSDGCIWIWLNDC